MKVAPRRIKISKLDSDRDERNSSFSYLGKNYVSVEQQNVKTVWKFD